MPQPMRVASPLATSSKITLDHPLHAPLPFTLPHVPPSERSDPALPILLNYASDDELINSLQSSSTDSASSNPFNLSVNWTSTIDPALAYLTLRSRPAFTPFLSDRDLGRNIEQIYGALRPSGLHQRLVSDLLLRNPAPKLLAKIIDMDANGLKARSFDNLRTSLITAIYSHLPDTQRKQFSRSTNIRISKALVSQGDTRHIGAIFHNLYSSTVWEPEGVWVLLSLILHLTQHQASHPQAPAITVLSIVIRSLLSYRFYGRIRHLSTDLFGLLAQTKYHGPAWELLLEICRVNLVGGTNTEMEFINKTLSGMAKVPGAPVLPKSTVNDYIGSVRHRVGAAFYFSLDEAIRPALTAGNILRFAHLKEVRVTRLLEKEIGRVPKHEWETCREAFEVLNRLSKKQDWADDYISFHSQT
jgi:hypothetical protein